MKSSTDFNKEEASLNNPKSSISTMSKEIAKDIDSEGKNSGPENLYNNSENGISAESIKTVEISNENKFFENHSDSSSGQSRHVTIIDNRDFGEDTEYLEKKNDSDDFTEIKPSVILKSNDDLKSSRDTLSSTDDRIDQKSKNMKTESNYDLIDNEESLVIIDNVEELSKKDRRNNDSETNDINKNNNEDKKSLGENKNQVNDATKIEDIHSLSSKNSQHALISQGEKTDRNSTKSFEINSDEDENENILAKNIIKGTSKIEDRNNSETQFTKSMVISMNTNLKTNKSIYKGSIVKPKSVPEEFTFNKFKKKIVALNEIFESEIIYFTDMITWGNDAKELILSDDKLPIKKRTQLVNILFAGINDIIELHSRIIEGIVNINQSIWPRKLKDRYSIYDIQNIADMHYDESLNGLPSILDLNELSYTHVFLANMASFDCYIKYVTTLPRSEYELILEHDTNINFRKTLDYFFKEHKIHNLGIKHFIYRPPQKIARYDMLFKAAFKAETCPVERKNIELFRKKIKKINNRMDTTFGEITKYFDTFKLTKEIKYKTGVSRQYPLSLFYKKQRILKQGFYNIILDENDVKDGRLMIKERYLIILTNLILICDYVEKNKVCEKTIITTPHHLLVTTAIDSYMEVSYLKNLQDKSTKSFHYLYLVEKQRDNIVIICFSDKISRDVVKNIINDACKELNKNYVQGIEIKKFQLTEKMTGVHDLFTVPVLLRKNKSQNIYYDDNILKFGWGNADEGADGESDSSTNKYSDNEAIYATKECCIKYNNRKSILPQRKKKSENDKFKIKGKKFTSNKKLENKSHLMSANSKTAILNNFKMLQDVIYNTIYTNNASIDGKFYNKSRSVINKSTEDYKIKKGIDKSYLSSKDKITTIVRNRTSAYTIYNNCYKKIISQTLSKKIEFLTPNYKKIFNPKKDILIKKYLAPCKKNKQYKLYTDKKSFTGKLVKAILIENTTDDKTESKIIKNSEIEPQNESSIFSHNKNVKSSENEKFRCAIESGMLFEYQFMCNNNCMMVSLPKLKPKQGEKDLYCLEREDVKIYDEKVDKVIYDNRRNIVVILVGNTIKCGFFNIEKPIKYTTISTSAIDFFYNKNANIIAAVEKTIDKTTCIIIYRVNIFNQEKTNLDKCADILNKYDKNRLFKVEILGKTKKFYKIQHANNTGYKIKTTIENRLYIGSNIRMILFIGSLIAIVCQDFELVNLNTLKTEEIVDSLDFVIPYYTKFLKNSIAIKIIQLTERKYFIIQNNIGYFVDNFGRNISNHKIFCWIFPVKDAKFIRKKNVKKIFGIDNANNWICLISDNGLEIWDIKTGDLIHYETRKNIKFLRNKEIPMFYNENEVFMFGKIK